MADHEFSRRHLIKAVGATGVVSAASVARGENRNAPFGQTPTGGEHSAPVGSGQPIGKGHAMSAGGLSKARLDRMHNVLAGHVEHGGVPGLVTLLSRRGEVHVDAIGMKAAGGKDSMRRDTIFRIASISKPITAAAAMILVEECKLRLDEPVDRLLPELANRKVLKRLDGPIDDSVPAKRPITVRDLLTFRMGLGIIMAPPDTYPIQKAVAELKIEGMGRPNRSATHTPDEWIRRLATLPLMHQPGEQWMYNIGSYVLSVLIARASGKPFETFLRERIFQPLEMKDTGFTVPVAKLDRLASFYMVNPATGALMLEDGAENSQWGRPPAFPDGGGGLVSTVDDFLAFARMLLNKGKHGNERILSRPSVETMTTDHLTAEQKATSPFPGLWENRGWGFGVCVVNKRDSISATPGQYGWNGGFGTSWSNDPAEDMIGIVMTQRAFTSPIQPDVIQDFWTLVYQAIDD
jgi:CubicO group peptidase (beta-lactamase class C family)